MKAALSLTSQAPFGPGSLPAAAARCASDDDRPRAKTASAIPETGMPRSSAVCTVQVPVPFIPAASRMTSISGLPVDASTWASTSAVISIRNESRSPLFHSPKISPISAGVDPAPQVVRLGDQLHVGVLDAVVHHLDEVPGTVGADVGAARRAVDVRRDLLQDRAERLVRLGRTTRHDGRAVQRALLA